MVPNVFILFFVLFLHFSVSVSPIRSSFHPYSFWEFVSLSAWHAASVCLVAALLRQEIKIFLNVSEADK
jgi:hypothetical protein